MILNITSVYSCLYIINMHVFLMQSLLWISLSSVYSWTSTLRTFPLDLQFCGISPVSPLHLSQYHISLLDLLLNTDCNMYSTKSVLLLYLFSYYICSPTVSVLPLYLFSYYICSPTISALLLYLFSYCICPPTVSVLLLYLSQYCNTVYVFYYNLYGSPLLCTSVLRTFPLSCSSAFSLVFN